jgi:hypothetical protein
MILEVARLCGVDIGALRRAPRTIRALRSIARERDQFRERSTQWGGRTAYPQGRFYPIIEDRYATAGIGSGQYFHQDLLVAQAIAKATPNAHVDIGGRVDGFVAHLASFRHLYYVDLRRLPEAIPNVTTIQADITSAGEIDSLLERGVLPLAPSVSFLHTIEHIGLGRYGDILNPAGHVRALENVVRLIEPNGTLYLSTPIGRPRVEFNAHRVFHPMDIEELLDTLGLAVASRSLVDDDGGLERDVSGEHLVKAVDAGLRYGLGIWFAVRLPAACP